MGQAPSPTLPLNHMAFSSLVCPSKLDNLSVRIAEDMCRICNTMIKQTVTSNLKYWPTILNEKDSREPKQVSGAMSLARVILFDP